MGVDGDSLYYFCNFPVNLKLFQNKKNKVGKATREEIIRGSSTDNSFRKFSRKGKGKNDGSLRRTWGQKGARVFGLVFVPFKLEETTPCLNASGNHLAKGRKPTRQEREQHRGSHVLQEEEGVQASLPAPQRAGGRAQHSGGRATGPTAADSSLRGQRGHRRE